MTTVKVHAEIDPDGTLRLEVPVGLPAGAAEVLLVIQPEEKNGHGKVYRGTARSGLFGGEGPADIDVDAALNEMNEAWKSKLS